MPRDNPSWTSYFDRFWIDFGSQLVTPEPTKSLKFYWFYRHFLLCGIFKIRSSFDSILVPTCFHFSSQNRPKSLPESISKAIDVSIDFRIDFCTVLATTWNPLGPQDGIILAFKIGREPSKTPPKTHLGAKTRPDLQDGSTFGHYLQRRHKNNPKTQQRQ